MKIFYKIIPLVVLILLLTDTLYAQSSSHEIAQIRIYQLKANSQSAFHTLFTNQAVPLLKKWNIKVSSYGLSKENENGYHLVRTFKSIQELEDKEGAFYSSDEWRDGPREEILSLIEAYSTLIIPKDSLQNYSVKSLTMQEMDKIILSKLNAQFIENFINEDVEAHEKIIHHDFVCIYGDGTIVNREEYMKNWASAYTNSGYTSFSITDEVIRIFDDMALVRSKTVYTKEVDGETVHGNSLYTDTYIKENGEWLCVQAHITPVAEK